jgi:hypothetical protein
LKHVCRRKWLNGQVPKWDLALGKIEI